MRASAGTSQLNFWTHTQKSHFPLQEISGDCPRGCKVWVVHSILLKQTKENARKLPIRIGGSARASNVPYPGSTPSATPPQLLSDIYCGLMGKRAHRHRVASLRGWEPFIFCHSPPSSGHASIRLGNKWAGGSFLWLSVFTKFNTPRFRIDRRALVVNLFVVEILSTL